MPQSTKPRPPAAAAGPEVGDKGHLKPSALGKGSVAQPRGCLEGQGRPALVLAMP